MKIFERNRDSTADKQKKTLSYMPAQKYDGLKGGNEQILMLIPQKS